MKARHIAAVILNYNSESDLITCADQLVHQENVKLSIILVDNASRPESVAEIKDWLGTWRADSIIGTQTEVAAWVKCNPNEARSAGRVYFIMHHENRGYSAGNNIGIQLGEALGADAVLIANPDMRIGDTHYLSELKKELFSNEINSVAASRIVGLDGNDQNPLREANFWEELLWPVLIFSKFKKTSSFIIPISGVEPVTVPKVSGCCLLLRMSFLSASGYLDDGVFLYCEEPILSARIKNAQGRIVFIPSIVAVHAHERSAKENASRRMLLFIKSRRYYLRSYSGYGAFSLAALELSYSVLWLLHFAKAKSTSVSLVNLVKACKRLSARFFLPPR